MKHATVWETSGVVAVTALFCCALWGSAFPAIKIGYEIGGIAADAVGDQLLFAGYRFTLAGVLVLLLGSAAERRLLIPRRGTWGRIGRLSLLQTVGQYVFFYIGLAHTSGVTGSIMVGTNSLITILVAALIFREEKLTAAKTLGCLAGLLGVVAANWGGRFGGFRWNGEGLILASVVCYAFSSVLIKRYAQDESPVLLSGWQFALGGLALIVIGLLCGGRPTAQGWSPASIGMLLYLAFLSAVAYSLWGVLLRSNPVSRVAIYGFMNPVMGVILSAALLGEGTQAFRWQNLAALGLVSAGILLVNWFPHRRKEERV